MTDKSCPTCGVNLAEARQIGCETYTKEGDLYCCKGCADGTGCTCL